jgi:hypothetical protein
VTFPRAFYKVVEHWNPYQRKRPVRIEFERSSICIRRQLNAGSKKAVMGEAVAIHLLEIANLLVSQV